jgi:hypothetical protein
VTLADDAKLLSRSSSTLTQFSMPRPFLVTVTLFTLGGCAPPIARTTSRTAPRPSAGTATRVLTLGSGEREVLDVVQRLFDAMRNGDSAAMRSLFEPGARLASVGMPRGVLAISEDSVGMFLRAIAGWRILGITDTRRRENCPELPKR